MNVYFVTFRSVTIAQRGEGILRKSGIRCQLLRTPRWMEEQGCGYCLRFRGEDARPVLQLLGNANVQYRKVYSQNPQGDVVTYDLS